MSFFLMYPNRFNFDFPIFNLLHLYLIAVGVEELKVQEAVFLRRLHIKAYVVFALPLTTNTAEPSLC